MSNIDRGVIKTKTKLVLSVSLLALGLAACSGDDDTASSSGGSDGLWTWSSPDAWYESSGTPASVPADQQASASAQASGTMTTRSYEVEEVSPIDGRVTRRMVTETVPVDQASGQPAAPMMTNQSPIEAALAGATPEQVAAAGAPAVTASGPTVIPAGKLPQQALPPSGFGSADRQNANYSGSVRGSMSGSVAAPVAAPTATVESAPSPAPVAMPTQVATAAPTMAGAAPDVLVPEGMGGAASAQSNGPLVTSPAVAAAGRTDGTFDTDYLDLDSGSTQRFQQRPDMSVTERMDALETEIVQDYDAKWADLDFDGGAMRPQRQAAAAPQATTPYMTMPQQGQQGMGAAMASSIVFAPGSVALSPTDRRRILEAVVAQKAQGGVIEVIGSAANPASDRAGATAGYDLALARANKVGTALVEAGVPTSAIRVLVMGVTGQAKVDLVLR